MPDPRPARSPGRPQVFAHRGGAGLRPENTLLAFDHGLSLGADGLELDVHLSRDGVVVVHHDARLERTTSGRGPVAALTADELARLDAGWNFAGFRGAAGGVPTFRAVLDRYPVPLIVELKINDPRLAHKTIDAVRDAGAVERVALGSFGTRVLRAARAYEPAIRTGSSSKETRLALYRSWAHWPVRRPPYQEFQVPERSGSTRVVTPRFVRDAHEAGAKVHVWTVDDPADMHRLLDWGVDGLISDRPDIAVEVVRARTL